MFSKARPLPASSSMSPEQERNSADGNNPDPVFRLMGDAAPMLIWIAGRDGSWTWVNRRWLSFTGRAMDQQMGHGWIHVVHPDDRARCLEEFSSAIQHPREFEVECRLRRFDGEYRWMLNRGAPLYDREELQGFIGYCSDITDRQQARDALAESEAQLRAYFESAAQGILAVDAGGRIEEVNAKVLELFGYSR